MAPFEVQRVRMKPNPPRAGVILGSRRPTPISERRVQAEVRERVSHLPHLRGSGTGSGRGVTLRPTRTSGFRRDANVCLFPHGVESQYVERIQRLCNKTQVSVSHPWRTWDP